MAETFQSTRPVRGATPGWDYAYSYPAVSIHAPRAGRDAFVWDATRVLSVSIHAPRAGRDDTYRQGGRSWRVSIHAPRAGRDSDDTQGTRRRQSFNPRAPCGARLTKLFGRSPAGMFQSTRPVRGATLIPQSVCKRLSVSIHAPRAGRDRGLPTPSRLHHSFNPRAPCGARPPTP